jgi:hypothetical protein
MNAADYQVSQSDVRTSHHNADQALMTPARRVALDALEREFRDLLTAQPRAQS